MKRFFGLALIAIATNVGATEIYLCNGVYTDTPCGKKSRVEVFDDRPACEDRVRATVRHYEGKLFLLDKEYKDREFQLVKAYVQSPKMTQTTNVISVGGGGMAGAEAKGGEATSSSRSDSRSTSNSFADQSRRFTVIVPPPRMGE